MEVNYNAVHLADIFSKTALSESDFAGQYYKHLASKMAEYGSTLSFDDRNIATGGTDMDIYPWQSKAVLTKEQQKLYSVPQVFQDMIYQMKRPKSVLFTGADYSHVRITHCFEDLKSDITILNNIKLHYFEKCIMSSSDRFSAIQYDVLSMQDLTIGNSCKFDMIELWANQADTAYMDMNLFTNLLNADGILLICGTSDWSFLYENDTAAHPMYDMHEQLKFDDSVYVHHIPLHYGFTVVTKK
jgi:hypothetical protein